jgi:hypothetical protein
MVGRLATCWPEDNLNGPTSTTDVAALYSNLNNIKGPVRLLLFAPPLAWVGESHIDTIILTIIVILGQDISRHYYGEFYVPVVNNNYQIIDLNLIKLNEFFHPSGGDLTKYQLISPQYCPISPNITQYCHNIAPYHPISPNFIQ